MMTTTVIRHATLLATMDAQRREIADGALVIEDRQIAWVGATAELAPAVLDGAATVIDARGRVVLPGFVNTHHHFYQTLTRAVPAAQDAVLFDWLKTLYPIWAELTPDDVFVSTQLALTELLLSGCTTSSDHHYLWPNGSPARRSVCRRRDGRRAFSRCARQHEPGRKPGRAAARPRHRAGGSDPARQPPRGRELPRRRPLCHAPRGALRRAAPSASPPT
jgi:cytosine/adenosine deaminase-related metal-dependent hydrolase